MRMKQSDGLSYKKSVAFRINKNLFDLLNDYSDTTGISKNQILERALIEHIEKHWLMKNEDMLAKINNCK